MRTYEALYIVRPDIEDDDIQTIANEVETLVSDNGGTIVRSEIWGKRRLAYEVKKFNEGSYVLLRFTSEPDFLARLEGYFRLAEPVIRFLVVHFDKQMLRLEAEQLKRKEEEIKASVIPVSEPQSKIDDGETVGMIIAEEIGDDEVPQVEIIADLATADESISTDSSDIDMPEDKIVIDVDDDVIEIEEDVE